MSARQIIWPIVFAWLTACGFSSELDYNQTGGGDPVMVGFAAVDSQQDEASEMVSIPVKLSAASPSEVQVDYSLAGGSATRDVDFSMDEDTLVFAPGEVMHDIEVTINPDAEAEDDETVDISLTGAVGAELVGASHTLKIAANVLSRVSFMTDMSNAPESMTVPLMLVLDKPSGLPVTVDYMIAGNATMGVDHMLVAGTVTFPAGSTMQPIALTPIDDQLDEDPEDVVVTLTGSSGVVIGTIAQRTHRIDDNDAEPTVGFMGTSATAGEASGSVDLTVALSTLSGKTVTVAFTEDGGTATFGSDYGFASMAMLTFPPGVGTRTITINLMNDSMDEGSEDALTSLVTPMNATLSMATTYTLQITDNDPPPTVTWNPAQPNGSANEGNNGTSNHDYQIMLDAASSFMVTVPITLGGSATNGTDYSIRNGDLPVVFMPGETLKTVRVIVQGDSEPPPFEDSETVTLQINANPTNAVRGNPNLRQHTIVDDD